MTVRIEVATPTFFANVKNLTVEENRGTGRTYFLDKKGRIVAVARPVEGGQPCASSS